MKTFNIWVSAMPYEQQQGMMVGGPAFKAGTVKAETFDEAVETLCQKDHQFDYYTKKHSNGNWYYYGLLVYEG